jgi:hypothetical protein
MVLSPWQKGLWRIKIVLHISKCHTGWCSQMQALTSMFTIGGWKLPIL